VSHALKLPLANTTEYSLVLEYMPETPQPTPQKSELKSALSTVLETSLLPPERFNSSFTGKITDIKVLGDKICVLGAANDGHYDGVWINTTSGKSERLKLDPSSHMIANATERGYLPYGEANTTYTDAFMSIMRTLGFSNKEIPKYHDEWKKLADANPKHLSKNSSYENMMDKNVILKGPELYIQGGEWKLEKRIDADNNGGKRFVFRLGDTALTLDRSVHLTRLDTDSRLLGNDLPGKLKLQVEPTLFHVSDGTGKKLNAFPGTSPAIDPSAPAVVYYINEGKIYSLDSSGVLDRTSKPLLQPYIQVKNPQELLVDNNGNFLIIRDADQNLHIVDKESGTVLKKFEGVAGPVAITDDGDIIFADGKRQLREIKTNFKAIPKGGNAEAEKLKTTRLRELEEQFTKLDLSKLQAPKQTTVTETSVADTLRKTISAQTVDKIRDAQTPEDVEKILDTLQMLKSQPGMQPMEQVVDEFVTQARERLSQITTTSFEGQLTSFHGGLQEVHTVGDTMDLDKRYAELAVLRQKIEIMDPAKRREIDKVLEAARVQKEALINQYQGILLQTVQQTFPEVEQIIKGCGSAQEISTLGADAQVQQFELMLTNIRDPKVRKELRTAYNEAKQAQRTTLEAQERVADEQRRLSWAQTIEEARADLEEMGKEVARIADAKEVTRFERNPMVTAWRAKLLTLPPEIRDIEEKRLTILLSSRKQDMEHRKNLGAIGESGELKFGESTFPIYKEPPRIWQPKITPIPGAFEGLGYLIYEDAQGRIYDPHAVVNSDMSLPRTQEMIARYRTQADEYFESMKRKVPDFDERWVITDYHQEKLEELTEVLNIQRTNHKGISILEGEAGTGKNVLGDMLANLSNMELVTIPCNESTSKEDLMYDFQFDPVKGTYKLPSRLIEAIQTPGTIVFFDEINTLKPGIAKMLNSLFDYRRKIFITEGGKTKEIVADPTVIFMGAMNPQNYLGVRPLSPELKSRARIVDFNYPPFEEQKGGKTIYQPHEALVLSRYMDALSELKPQEFKDLWDFVVNKNQSSQGAMIAQGNPAMKAQVERMYDVLRVANKLRSMYEAYQIGESTEAMDFPTSLREMTDIVMEMNHGRDVRLAIERVILPKIDDRSQRKFVKETIGAILPGQSQRKTT